MKSPLRVGAIGAPKSKLQIKTAQPEAGKARRFASLSAAAAIVVGIGAASALFVDYLADRALARTAEAPATVKPVAAKAVETTTEAKVAAIAPAVAAPGSQPVEPPKAEIAVEAPDPAAIAKVAVGPEHAIELPTEDPTANPIVRAAKASAPADALSADEDASGDMPISAYAEDGADGTRTAAIDPDTAGPAIEDQPAKKAKRQNAEQGEPQPADTEVASLPGVDVGGLAGNPSDDDSTATRQTKNLGGLAAGTARVTSAVNMRSAPKKGAGVLTVVPAGSAVNVLSCDGWCQIAYNGRKGWVYKNYLSSSSASGAKPQKKSAAKPTSAAKPASPTAGSADSTPRKAISSRL